MRDPRTEIPTRLGDALIPLALLVWVAIATRAWLPAVGIFLGAMVVNFLEWLFYQRGARHGGMGVYVHGADRLDPETYRKAVEADRLGPYGRSGAEDEIADNLQRTKARGRVLDGIAVRTERKG